MAVERVLPSDPGRSWWTLRWVSRQGTLCGYPGHHGLGYHWEGRRGLLGETGRTFGPYLDLFLGWAVLSVGRLPAYVRDEDLSRHSPRGGRPASRG